MNVTYKISVSLLLVAIGLMHAAVHVWAWAATGALSAGVVVGFIVMGMGALSLGRPIFVLSADELQVFSLFGVRTRTYAVADLDVERDPGGRRKVLIARSRRGRRRRLFGSTSLFFDNRRARSVIAGVESGKAF